MKRKVALGLVSLLIGLSLSQAGCLGCFGPVYFGTADAGFIIKGTIYEWVNAPDGAISMIRTGSHDKDATELLEEMRAETSDDLSLMPLADAEIIVDIKNRKGESYGWPWVLYSDTKDQVHDYMTVSPERTIYTIRATKTGYMQIVTELAIPSEPYLNNILVILIREGN